MGDEKPSLASGDRRTVQLTSDALAELQEAYARVRAQKSEASSEGASTASDSWWEHVRDGVRALAHGQQPGASTTSTPITPEAENMKNDEAVCGRLLSSLLAFLEFQGEKGAETLEQVRELLREAGVDSGFILPAKLYSCKLFTRVLHCIAQNLFLERISSMASLSPMTTEELSVGATARALGEFAALGPRGELRTGGRYGRLPGMEEEGVLALLDDIRKDALGTTHCGVSPFHRTSYANELLVPEPGGDFRSFRLVRIPLSRRLGAGGWVVKLLHDATGKTVRELRDDTLGDTAESLSLLGSARLLEFYGAILETTGVEWKNLVSRVRVVTSSVAGRKAIAHELSFQWESPEIDFRKLEGFSALQSPPPVHPEVVVNASRTALSSTMVAMP